MRHMLQGTNLALTVGRAGQVIDSAQWNIVFVSHYITEFNLYRRGGNNLFPLYLYLDADKAIKEDMEQVQTWPEEKDGRRPNLDHRLVDEFAAKLKLTFVSDGQGDLKSTFGPEDVLHYIYALLHSPTYRNRYTEFLKLDFPRVSLTSDKELFCQLCEFGSELVALHLLESPLLVSSNFITRYGVRGDNLVEKGHPKYLAPGEPEPGTGKPVAEGRVYISKGKPKENKQGQYFEGVPPEVWEFYVGGYQVCEKWLKDRRGRTLSHDDLTHYQKVVLALQETIRLMDQIDQAIESHGGWPVK